MCKHLQQQKTTWNLIFWLPIYTTSICGSQFWYKPYPPYAASVRALISDFFFALMCFLLRTTCLYHDNHQLFKEQGWEMSIASACYFKCYISVNAQIWYGSHLKLCVEGQKEISDIERKSDLGWLCKQLLTSTLSYSEEHLPEKLLVDEAQMHQSVSPLFKARLLLDSHSFRERLWAQRTGHNICTITHWPVI